MFLLSPALIGRGTPFWLALALGCLLTIALCLLLTWISPRFGLNLSRAVAASRRLATAGSRNEG